MNQQDSLDLERAADGDLVTAAAQGFVLLPKPALGGCHLSGIVLSFDPQLDPKSRAKIIRDLIATEP